MMAVVTMIKTMTMLMMTMMKKMTMATPMMRMRMVMMMMMMMMVMKPERTMKMTMTMPMMKMKMVVLVMMTMMMSQCSQLKSSSPGKISYRDLCRPAAALLDESSGQGTEASLLQTVAGGCSPISVVLSGKLAGPEGGQVRGGLATGLRERLTSGRRQRFRPHFRAKLLQGRSAASLAACATARSPSRPGIRYCHCFPSL